MNPGLHTSEHGVVLPAVVLHDVVLETTALAGSAGGPLHRMAGKKKSGMRRMKQKV